MNILKVVEAVTHLIDAVEGLQLEGPAGATVSTAAASARVAIGEAMAEPEAAPAMHHAGVTDVVGNAGTSSP